VAAFRYVVVDVFTDTALHGNQLAVFTDARELPEHLLQPLAREMAFSETVFVYPSDGEGHARIRIFTPAVELRFAGHPILGTAYVLAAPLQLDELRLETGVGVVPVHLERDGNVIVFGRMEQPVPSWQPFAEEAQLLAALGVERSELPVELYDNGVRFVFVELPGGDVVRAVRPDLAALSRWDAGAYCFAGEGTRWKARMFFPAHGVPEDPATGSAAGSFSVHLTRHGRAPLGEWIEIAQGEEIGRPSKLFARATGSGAGIERVEVGGSAVVVARGEFRL
jgi:trans-2,3-dihydro-3-hydroxyanthranilate isomerase